jgi:hypothetical protein
MKNSDMIATLDQSSEGKIRQVRPAARFSESPACLVRRLAVCSEVSRARADLFRAYRGRDQQQQQEAAWS